MRKSKEYQVRSTIFPDQYSLENQVFLPQGTVNNWGYNDGDEVERRILSILRSSQDLSCLSLELKGKITDWPTQYHLTPRRSNLLRPFSDLLVGSILEVGAGCGAITRFLGESGAEVFAVEGSPRRAAIARERTRDLPNVTVISDNIQNVHFNRKFDVITLIGVLEYARIFGDGPESTSELLNNLRERLAPGGTLIVAIENQLGLKYFAGANEDHKSVPYFGINDIYDDNGVVTFGKEELQRRLNDAGFAHCSWLYPFPDYKLPTTILPEAAFRLPRGSDLSALFTGSNFDDPRGAKPGTFSLDRAWGVIARNGLTEDLANSFLIACRTSDDPSHAPVTSPDSLAWHYSVDRHPAFAKQAVFERRTKGKLVVKRSHLTDATPPDIPLRFALDDEDFIPGRLWSAELQRLINRPRWTSRELADWLRFWIESVLASAGLEPGADLQTAEVPGRFLDAMPFNMVRDSTGAAHFIDLEWESRLPLSIRQLSYRALSKVLGRVTSCAAPAEGRHIVVAILIKDVLKHAGISINIRDMRDLEFEDRKLQQMVQNGALDGTKPAFVKFYLKYLKIRFQNSLAKRAIYWVRRTAGSN